MALKKSLASKESSAIQYLHQRRIALLGLGVENRALARFLRAHQIPFSACDARAPATPVEGVQQWRIGERYLDDLTDFDLLFRTPGLPTLDSRLCAARHCGVEVSSQTRLFLQLCPAPVLGVTGTKGKGTTTALLHALLATDPTARVFSGGNIGRPPLEFIDELQATDRVVLELSSFQLQDLGQSPHIAVVLSVTEDHLDYHADRAEYVAAKKSICRHQTPGDILIVNRDCPTARPFAEESPAALWSFSTTAPSIPGAWIADGQLWACCPRAQPTAICPVADLRLRGQHNWSNAAAAVAGALAFGAPATPFAKALRAFAGLPPPPRIRGRARRRGLLQRFASHDGRCYLCCHPSFQRTPAADRWRCFKRGRLQCPGHRYCRWPCPRRATHRPRGPAHCRRHTVGGSWRTHPPLRRSCNSLGRGPPTRPKRRCGAAFTSLRQLRSIRQLRRAGRPVQSAGPRPSRTIVAPSLNERPDLLYFVDRQQKIHLPAHQRRIRALRHRQLRPPTNR